MTFNYNEEEKNYVFGTGKRNFSRGRVYRPQNCPRYLAGKQWYQIRHSDDDDMEAASLKHGCVAVNFFGTFICDPIEGIKEGEEVEISEWDWDV